MRFPRQQLTGIVPPLLTPLAGRDTLDVPGLERLVEYVLTGGVSGLFLLGTTGEATALSGRLRRELCTRVIGQVRGRVPVLVCVSDTAIVESLELAEFVAETGGDAVVVTAPYYTPLDQGDLLRYVRSFSAECSLPIFLYNMPRLTTVAFERETIRRALEIANVVGLKDSSGDFQYFLDVLEIIGPRKDWSLLVGSESLLGAAIRKGAQGCVAGGANVWPHMFVDAYRAAAAGDDAETARTDRLIASLAEIYQFGPHVAGGIRGLKCAAELMGICSGRLADPLAPCDALQTDVIRERLVELGLLPVAMHGPEVDPRAVSRFA